MGSHVVRGITLVPEHAMHVSLTTEPSLCPSQTLLETKAGKLPVNWNPLMNFPGAAEQK